ncbi:restriction endonuclease subunit S [Metamycoplasma equirhinis]|uniref:restriction endonuclease subunit S n=2 Tax=Metamycoplasma equirhinis TaxID=92402 RepID=UPI003593030F
MEKLKKYIESAVTGLDAIQRAPIVDYETDLRCLRIGDISQLKPFNDWGFTNVTIDGISQFLIKKNDNFIARTGSTIGCSYFSKESLNSVFNNGIIRLRTTKGMLPQYLSFLIQTNDFRKYVNNVGMASATQPNIKINDMLDYELEVPSLDIQQHIVNTIGSVDDLIENLQKQNDILMNLGILKINEYNEKYELQPLNNIVSFDKGYEIGSSSYIESESRGLIHYLRVSDLLSLGNTYIETNDNIKIAYADDILVAFDGAPGRNNIGLLGAYSSGIYKLDCSNDNKGLVFFEINSLLNKKIIDDHSQGTTILHASKSINHLIYCELSNNEKEILNKYFNLILQNKKKIDSLKHIKANLLNKYF